MCCCTNVKQKHGHGVGSCKGNQFHPGLWSKKKKIGMLEDHLNNLKQETEEVESLISDLKSEK